MTNTALIGIRSLQLIASGECRHCSFTFGADALTPEHPDHRQGQGFEIQPKALVIYVPDVKFEFLLPTNGISSVYLRPAGEPGPDFVTPSLLWSVARQVLHQQRTRADQAHVAFQNI